MSNNNTSLFLAQSYQDAWEDYQRSLRQPAFPVWDYVILTASDEHQAEGFRAQLEARKEVLSSRTVFAVIPDEDGVRVGSGGATLSVLRYIREREKSFKGLRILVIHSGGDSKRVPQYSALGKLFSPVPHCLPDGRASSLFDESLIAVSSVPGRIREGMLLLSGDVLLLFNPLLIDYSGRGAAAISFKEPVATGRDHGVYLRGENGNVKAFLHKQPESELRRLGAVNDAGAVDIDTGALIFGVDVLNALYGLILTKGEPDLQKYRDFVNGKVRLSLYGDFQYPMAEDATLEQFLLEKPEGEMCPQLCDARRALWNALRPFRMKLMRLAPAKFIHFGTVMEIQRLMQEEVKDYRDLGWSRCVSSSIDDRCAGYVSVLSPNASVGRNCYLEVSYVHSGARVGDGTVLSYVDLHEGDVIPSYAVLHALKLMNGKFVCRIYGVKDNPKEGFFFGNALEQIAIELNIGSNKLWPENEEHSLWNALLYPECDTVQEAVSWAVRIYKMAVSGEKPSKEWESLNRQSLCSGFHEADPKALLSWNQRMRELVQMNDIERLIEEGRPAHEAAGKLDGPLSPVQEQWMCTHLDRADLSRKMRLHYYVGTALGDIHGGIEVQAAFGVLRKEVLDRSLTGLTECRDASIVSGEYTVSLPLRVNWGGGWSDTPPYCHEKGGTVLNAAILLEGKYPVSVTLKRLEEPIVIFESRDMDLYGTFDTIEALQAVGDPFDPFALQKAALLSCGIIPVQGGSLKELLARLGGGFLMDTEVTRVPKGSGLGTSSILAAACVKALLGFMGISCTQEELYSRVLCMEQIMSTGGGWQDQAGGLSPGIKFITSRPGFPQKLRVEKVELDDQTAVQLNQRFALIYTGQRRLARNLLRDVVGRYIGNESDAVFALNEIQRIAALMRFELERGNIDAFARLLSRHWELSKKIDAGSSNTLINQIFDAVEDLICGRMICGAGGGGFLQVILRSGVSKEEVQQRLREMFQDSDVCLWDAAIIYS